MTTTKKSRTHAAAEESTSPDADFEKAFAPPKKAAASEAPPAPAPEPEPVKAPAPRTRPGYLRCEVLGEGEVVVEGYVGEDKKLQFKGGDVGEFLESDVESLPGVFRRVT